MMNEATCAVLSGVFPLVLIAVVTDRRSIHLNLRTHGWYRRLVIATIAICLVGLGVSVVGVQSQGFVDGPAFLAWSLFVFALAAFGTSVVMNVATQEIEEDDAVQDRRPPASAPLP